MGVRSKCVQRYSSSFMQVTQQFIGEVAIPGREWRENKLHYYLVLLYRDNCVTERGTPVI